MVRQRVIAVLLFLVAFVAVTLSRTSPFLDDLSELAKTAIAVGGAACLLVGVSLWFRKESGQQSPQVADASRPDGD